MNNKIILALFVIMTLVLYGCGQAEEPTTVETPADDTAATPAEQTEATAEPTEVAAPVEEETVLSGVKDKLKGIMQIKPEYKVEYEFKTVGGEEEIAGSQTHYFKDEDFRTDTTMEIEGQKMQTSTFVLAENLYTCSNMMDQWSCMEFPKMEAEEEEEGFEMQSFTENFEETIDKWDIESAPSRTIAGEKAECFKTKFSEDDYEVETEMCYSKDGVPLYMRHDTPEGYYELKAKSFSKSVSSSDFKLPAEPTQFPMMGMGEEMTPEEMEALAQQMQDKYGQE